MLGTLNSAFSCAFWQSEEDKQLQDELEMLVERLGVSLWRAFSKELWSQEPWPGLESVCPLLMVVPCAVVVGEFHLERGHHLSAVLCPPALLPV